VISKEQFQQRAKELGFVWRYRWGIEYKTDGKRPELADDVEIKWLTQEVKKWWPEHDNTTVGELVWNGKYSVDLFKITDQRYKPADTSYLDRADGIEQLCVDDHFDMSEFKCQFNRLPEPMKSALKQSFDDWFRAEVLSRKAKAERERAVDAVMREFPAANELILCDMYDKGFLRLPD
jgi:hypothetical protein